MVTIFWPFEPNTGGNLASKSTSRDCLRDYAQDVRLEGGLRILGSFGAGADFWAHRARLPLHLSISLLATGYLFALALSG